MRMSDNRYRQCNYLLSAHNSSQFPDDFGREVAFVGRSNVGKSSVINKITDQKRLAKTSKTPGRTRQINFFTVEDGIRLVDLPGYGFAKVDRSLKIQWRKVINSYFENRTSLVGLFLIMDIRRQITDDDRVMIDWCKHVNIPVHIVINKADKLPFQKRKQAYGGLEKEFKGISVTSQLFSSVAKIGEDNAVETLDSWLYPDKTRPR